MTELLLNPSREIIKLNKPVLSFNVNANAKIHKRECELKIKNLTLTYVALRIKTTKKEDYAVIPSHCIILPDDEVNVHFIYNPANKSILPPQGTKFKFDAIVINNVDKDKDPIFLFEYFIQSRKVAEGNSIKRGVEFITSYEKINEEDNKINKEIKVNMSIEQKNISILDDMKVRGARPQLKNNHKEKEGSTIEMANLNKPTPSLTTDTTKNDNNNNTTTNSNNKSKNEKLLEHLLICVLLIILLFHNY